MTAPTFRSVDQHTGDVKPGGTMAVTIREIDDMRTEIIALRTRRAEEQDTARAEIDNLTTLLKASGIHVANLSSAVAQYQVERDEWRERAEEWRGERDEARTRIQELSTALASAVNACDTANAKAAVL